RCDYTRSQQWTLGKPGRDKSRKISHADSGKCLGIADASGQDGVETRAYACAAKADPDLQAFTLTTTRPVFTPPGMDGPVAASDPVPLVRYARTGSRAAHVFKLGPADWETGKQGYQIEIPQGTILPKRAAKTRPLYRYRHAGRDQHLYVTDFLDYRFAKDGYAFDGVLGYVLVDETKGAVALRRYRHNQTGDDLLTVDDREYGGDKGRGGYAFMGVQGWVAPYRAAPVGPLSAVAAVTQAWHCLAGPVDKAGGPATIQPCALDGTARFTYFDDDSFRDAASGLCLAFENNRMPAVWETCSYRHPRQRLRLHWTGKGKAPKAADGKRALRLEHVAEKRCIALQQGQATAGNGLTLAACADKSSQPDQDWRPMAELPRAKAMSGWRGLTLNGDDGMCISGPPAKRNGQVTLRSCGTGRRQTVFTRYDDGTLRVEETGTCLTLPAAGGGKPATLAPCLVNSPAQAFDILWNGSGKTPKGPATDRAFRLRHQDSKLCLGARGGNWQDGTRVTLGTCAKSSGKRSQNWRFGSVGTEKKP
ncbi:MAG: ricin-type beta-trefoil lectin domain protein, partial [Alphaproteobacteria bacterium]